MRRRSVLLVLIALAAVIGYVLRRRPSEHVDVHFDDGSTIRLTGGPEAAELLDDVYAVLHAVA